MAYVGTPIDTRNQFQSLQGKRFSGDGSTTDFTLDVAPGNVLDIEVFVGNVRQDPNSAYTVSGTTLSFTGAPPSGTNNIYVVHQAKSVGTIDVPAGGVAAGSLASSVLTGQTDIGGAIADADLFLVDDGAGGTLRKTAASRIKTYAGGAVTALNNATADELVTVGSTTTELDAEANLTFDGGTLQIDSGDSTSQPALKIIQRGGYNGLEITADSTNTGSAQMKINAITESDVRIDLMLDSSIQWLIRNDYSDSNRLEIFDNDGDGVYLNQNSTSWTGTSDERLKSDWTNITEALTKIDTLTKLGTHKMKKYDKDTNTISEHTDTNKKNKLHLGVSAQEIEAILPQAVTNDENGIKGVTYTDIIPLLLKAIQELSAKVKKLEEG